MTTQVIENKVTISIRLKILASSLIMLFVSVFAFSYYSIDKIFQDKTAYIYENVLNNVESLRFQMDGYLRDNIESLKNLANSYHHSDLSSPLLKGVFHSNQDMFHFEIFSNKGYGWSREYDLIKTNVIQRHNAPDDFLLEHLRSNPAPFELIKKRKIHVDFFTEAKVPHVQLSFYSEEFQEIFVGRLILDKLGNIFKSNSSFVNSVYTSVGKPVLGGHEDEGRTVPDYIKSIINIEFKEGVNESQFKQETFLTGYQKVPTYGLMILSNVDKDKAFSVAYLLIKKSFAFVIIIISLGVIVGTMLARNLTQPVDMLMWGTRKISEGEFGKDIPVRTNDELGVLAGGFNFMSKEIKRYIHELKDKVRMENELQVASLVQDSFFPDKNTDFDSLSVSGYYKSASECGGDWWGAMEIRGKVILFIGDATGHGVAPAMVTATVTACANLLEDVATYDPDIINSPAAIMEMMNLAVHQLGGEILMTFFTGVYNPETKILTYTNGSHNNPLVCRYNEGKKPGKEDIVALMDAVGPRLGHKKDPQYTEAQIELYPGDTIVLMSDGIIEAENPEKKQWGKRRFLKSFMKHSSGSPKDIIDGMCEEAYAFYEGVPPDDDVTLVAAKLKA